MSIGTTLRYAKSNIRATKNGFFDANQLKGEMNSFIGKDIMRISSGAYYLHQLSKEANILFDIRHRELEKITSSKVTNAAKLNDNIQDLIKLFNKRLETSKEYIFKTTDLLKNINLNINTLEISTVNALSDSISDIGNLIDENKLKVGFEKKHLEEARKELKKTLEKLEKSLETDISKNIKTMTTQFKNKVKFSYMEEKLIEFKEQRAGNIFQKRYFSKIIEIKAQIDEQIRTQRIKLNFPSLIIEYSKNLAKTNNLAEKIRKDLEKIFDKFKRIIQEILNYSIEFYSIVSREENTDIIRRTITDIKKDLEDIQKILKDSTNSITDAHKNINMLEKSMDTFIISIENAYKNYKEELEEEFKPAA